MAAVYSNLYVEQGATFDSVIDVVEDDGTPVDLELYDARAHFRKSYTSSTYHAFACEIIQPERGKIQISLTSAQTGALKPGRYVYDVEIFTTDGNGDDDLVYRIVEGQLDISPEVTR